MSIGAGGYAMVAVPALLVRQARAQAQGIPLDIQSMGETTPARLGTDELGLAFIGATPPAAPLKSQELFRERFIGLLCARHPPAIKAGRHASPPSLWRTI